MEEKIIDFKKIEKKWQERWEKKKVFEVKENPKKKKYYVLEQFPYPSGTGLHIGHSFVYTIGDIYARFRRMQGFNLLHPIGFDALGLPAENAAIRAGTHPEDYTNKSTKYFLEQMKKLGFSYDWSKLIYTTDPQYYKWDQWIFLKMLEKGLAYRKKSGVNWCPKCKTVLANEQVHDGKCEYHGDTSVEIKHLDQWYLKITDYNEELANFEKVKHWPDLIKKLQKNWIGKSYGSEIEFDVENPDKNISNVIIVHGSNFSEKDSQEGLPENERHWKPWIKRELNKKGIKVSNELYPKDWLPDYNEWKRVFEKNKIDENSILIGHSAGTSFLLRWLSETKKRVNKVILIAPSVIKDGKYLGLSKLKDFEFDSSLKKYFNELCILYADNDDEDIIQSAMVVNKKLGGKLVNLSGKGHFTERDMGTVEFPELLNEILSGEKWPIFTTRPDTIYGVTFMVVSSQHPRLMELVTDKQKKYIEEFLRKIKSVSEKEMEELEKEGVFTGSYAINPINNEKIPIYAGNFVIADYGSGMVMAVPSHDQRDFEFAKKYNIPIKEVIMPVFGEQHKDEVFRKTISAVVHRKKDNKFLIMKWKDTKWVAPIVGGIEDNEDLEKAAEREVLEESGYKTKFVKKLGGEIVSHFYADHKKVWRHRLDQPVLMELIDEKQNKVSDDEKNRHEAVWLDADDALKEMTHAYNNLGLLRYLGKESAYTENGILVNSEKFNGMDSEKAKDEIIKFLEKKKLGKKTINFRLRDWLVSRQRYWGTPIPIIYCDKCGIVPVPEKQLPVKLPRNVKFGEGNPLATNKQFVNTKCPKCKGKARRETDTMDTFVNSSWYFLRYCDSKNKKEIFDRKKAGYWVPIDIYVGGKEHACMHDIYMRFYTKFLRDLGLLKIDEPAIKLFVQGIVHGEDGNKMSKSLGNVVDPMTIIKNYNADSLRLFLVSNASPESDFNWSEKGIQGSFRFLNRVLDYFNKCKIGKSEKKIESKLNKAIKEITDDIDSLRYNLAVIKIRQLFEELENEKEISKKDLEDFLKMLSVFCPHISEELWEKIGNKSFISLADWPVCDEKKIDEKFEKEDEAIEKLKQDINNIKKIMESKGEKKEKVYVYVIPKELELYKNMEGISVYAVNDKNKHDPQNKAGKAKLGKPAIYLE